MVQNMFPSLLILYDSNVFVDEVHEVISAIKHAFDIEIRNIEEYNISESAYNSSRDQYDGQKLLNMLIDERNMIFFLWILQDDLFVPDRNFVFGLGSKYYGAIVSFHRLNSIEMKIKESIHETAHIFGLGHCSNFCVMQYSSSLVEALQKPSTLCNACQLKLKENSKNFERNKD